MFALSCPNVLCGISSIKPRSTKQPSDVAESKNYRWKTNPLSSHNSHPRLFLRMSVAQPAIFLISSSLISIFLCAPAICYGDKANDVAVVIKY